MFYRLAGRQPESQRRRLKCKSNDDVSCFLPVGEEPQCSSASTNKEKLVKARPLHFLFYVTWCAFSVLASGPRTGSGSCIGFGGGACALNRVSDVISRTEPQHQEESWLDLRHEGSEFPEQEVTSFSPVDYLRRR